MLVRMCVEECARAGGRIQTGKHLRQVSLTAHKLLHTIFLQYLYAVRLTCRKSVPVCILPSARARLYVDILTMFYVFQKRFS